jgi:hypothetical protein
MNLIKWFNSKLELSYIKDEERKTKAVIDILNMEKELETVMRDLTYIKNTGKKILDQ